MPSCFHFPILTFLLPSPDQLPLGNFSVAIALPEVSAGDYQLFAAVPYLVGASGTVDVETFYFNITITDA